MIAMSAVAFVALSFLTGAETGVRALVHTERPQYVKLY